MGCHAMMQVIPKPLELEPEPGNWDDVGPFLQVPLQLVLVFPMIWMGIRSIGHSVKKGGWILLTD